MGLGIFVSLWLIFLGLTGQPYPSLWLMPLRNLQRKGCACFKFSVFCFSVSFSSLVSIWKSLQNCRFLSEQFLCYGERKRIFSFPPCFSAYLGIDTCITFFGVCLHPDAMAVIWQQCHLQPISRWEVGYQVWSKSVFLWYCKHSKLFSKEILILCFMGTFDNE